jgi:hypothetical protein
LRDVVEQGIASRIDWAAWKKDELAELAELRFIREVISGWPGISGHASK